MSYRPIPTHLRLVTGNRSKRPLPQNEPKPQPVMPAVPAHLPDEAKVEWGRLANELNDLGLLTRLDRAVLTGYCQAWADYVEAENNLRQYGKVIRSPSRSTTRRRRDGSEVTESSGGYPMQSPFLAIRNRAMKMMKEFAIEMGLSPSSRSRVSVGPTGSQSGGASKYIG